MFQMGGIGPMFGQVGFFNKFAGKDYEDKRPRDRYVGEAKRLLGVLDERLAGRAWIMGDDYTIADIATFPWVRNLVGFYGAGELVGIDAYPQVSRALAAFVARPAVQAGLLDSKTRHPLNRAGLLRPSPTESAPAATIRWRPTTSRTDAMTEPTERRRAERRQADPEADEDLSPEYLALLEVCGGEIRATDRATLAERRQIAQAEAEAARARTRKPRRRGPHFLRRTGAGPERSEVLGGERRGRLRGQALVALAQAGKARIGLAVAGLEVGLAAAAHVHLRARHHRLHAGLAGRPGRDVLGLASGAA